MTTSLRVTWATWVSQSAPTSNYFKKTGYLAVNNQSSHYKFAYLWFANPFPRTGANVLSAKLTLRTRKVTGSGTVNLGVDLATPYPVGIGSMNWNTRASAAGHKVQMTKSAPLAENAAWTFDVTEMMQTVGSGYGFNGFIISTTNTRDINIQGNMSAALDPVLEVEWTEAPLAPDQLAPSTGQATGVALPVLRWSFWDHAGATGLGAAHVQVASAEDGFGSPLWDSGSLPLTETQLDLSATDCPAPAADTLRWWRVRNQDSAGLWSAWSDPVSWQWHPRLSVELVQPEPDAVDVVGPELLTNGTFESQLTGWTTTGTWSVASGGPDGAFVVSSNAPGSTISQTIPASGRLRLTYRAANTAPGVSRIVLTPNVGSPVEVTIPSRASGWSDLTTADVTLPDGATSAVYAVIYDSGSNCRVDSLSARMVTAGQPTFSDPTPVIQWATSGDMPQSRWRASVSVLEGSAWRVVAASGTVVSAETSWTPDVGLADEGTVRIIVDVWDDRQREATPGVPIYASASGEFAFSPSDTIETPKNIQLIDLAPMPSVKLRFTRSEVPDRWDIYRDGKLLTRHPGLDFLVEGDRYEVTDALAPNGTHTWTIFAIVNGVACRSQAITAIIRHTGTWLCDEITGDKVCIVGGDKDLDLSMPEDRTTFTPIGSKARVDIIAAQRGYEATHKGLLVGNPATGKTAEEQFRILMGWRGDPGRRLILLVSDMAFPVAVNNIQGWRTTQVTTPRFPGDPGHVVQVSFDWHQIGDFVFGED
jgi:hypothetical protein